MNNDITAFGFFQHAKDLISERYSLDDIDIILAQVKSDFNMVNQLVAGSKVSITPIIKNFYGSKWVNTDATFGQFTKFMDIRGFTFSRAMDNSEFYIHITDKQAIEDYKSL